MDKLIDFLRENSIELNDNQIDSYKFYMDKLLEWNEKINLTAITDKDEFVVKHYIDSLLVLNMDEYRKSKDVIDIGTGGGFPGIPLAIASPNKRFILEDSLLKRLKVIDDISSEMDLDNIVTVHGRAEVLGKDENYRESFDLCVSRAVANLAVLCEYCLPFVHVGGYFLAYKGPEVDTELENAAKAIDILGGKLIRVEEKDSFGYKHNIVVIKKVKKTPKKYPRKAGTPSKQPL